MPPAIFLVFRRHTIFAMFLCTPSATNVNIADYRPTLYSPAAGLCRHVAAASRLCMSAIRDASSASSRHDTMGLACCRGPIGLFAGAMRGPDTGVPCNILLSPAQRAAHAIQALSFQCRRFSIFLFNTVEKCPYAPPHRYSADSRFMRISAIG